MADLFQQNNIKIDGDLFEKNGINTNKKALENNVQEPDKESIGWKEKLFANLLINSPATKLMTMDQKNPMSWFELALKMSPIGAPLQQIDNTKNAIIENKNKKRKEMSDKYGIDNSQPLQITEGMQKQMQAEGKRDFVENLKYNSVNNAIPFISGISSITEKFDINKISQKIDNGEDITPEEMEKYNLFMLEQAETAYRGTTIGGKTIDVISHIPAFAGEFLATGGIGSIGRSAVQQTITKGLQEVGKKEIGKRLVKGTAEAIGDTALRLPLGMPHMVIENYQDRRLTDGLTITAKGQWLLKESQEKPYMTFLKAFGDGFIEIFSEMSGGGLRVGASSISREVLKKMPKGTVKELYKFAKKITPPERWTEMLSKTGFNGILEEYGEERLGNLLRGLTGVDDRDIPLIDKLIDAVVPDKEQALVEIGAFGVWGGTSYATLSLADKLLSRGLKKDEVENILHSTSELEKEEMLEEFEKQEPLKGRIEYIEKKSQEVYDATIKAGFDEKRAETNAALHKGVLHKALLKWGEEWAEKGIDFQPVLDRLTFKSIGKIEKPADLVEKENEQAKEEMQKVVDQETESSFFKVGNYITDGAIAFSNNGGNVEKLKQNEMSEEEEATGINSLDKLFSADKYDQKLENPHNSTLEHDDGSTTEVVEFPMGISEEGLNTKIIIDSKYYKMLEGYDLYAENKNAISPIVARDKNGNAVALVMPVLSKKSYENPASLEGYPIEKVKKLIPFDKNGNKIDVSTLEKVESIDDATHHEMITGEFYRLKEKKTKKEVWDGIDETDKNGELPKFKAKKKPAKVDFNKIDDFGEKIEGAKKDTWTSYKSIINKDLPENVALITMSKDFPEPNYELLIREGADTKILATIKALRDCIPTKPKYLHKLKKWGEIVKNFRELAQKLINGDFDIDRLDEMIKSVDRDGTLFNRVELYREIGYPDFKGLKNYSIRYFSNEYYANRKPEYAIVKGGYVVERYDSREDAIEGLRSILSSTTKNEKSVKLDIYQVRKTGEIIIGKKVGTNKYIDLKGGFTTAKDAREFLKENEEALLDLLKQKKETPETRGAANRVRIGDEYRNGENVTPEKFASEFGFRGVQFGNDVEQKKRAEDLNESYDSLLDLANIIKVPARALSLNGTLGLAFGARGEGGKHPAKAHYESLNVVINLTKKKGAGSLAHEWWHALDNFFAKETGNNMSMLTDLSKNASTGIREEVFDSFKNIIKTFKETGLYDRSKKLDETRTKDYWSTNIEMGARAFESYIIKKAKDLGITNDYLANILSPEVYANKESYPYILQEEYEQVFNAFDDFFKTLKTKETEKGITFYQTSDTPDDAKGMYTRKQGKSIIEILETADESTMPHELAHFYLDVITLASQHSETAQDDLRAINEMLGHTDSKPYTREEHEEFAKTFEKYLRDGKAPNSFLAKAFENFKEWLAGIVENFELNETQRNAINRLFMSDEEYEEYIYPKYKENEDLINAIAESDKLSVKFKDKMNSISKDWSKFYDALLIPIETRLGKITPILKNVLREHTFTLLNLQKKDSEKITPFLKAINKLKKDRTTVKISGHDVNAYAALTMGLNNRDNVITNSVIKQTGLQAEFNEVRLLLDELHDSALKVGIDVNFLHSYFPRLVKRNKTDNFIELFEKMLLEEEIDIKNQVLDPSDAQYSNVKRSLREADPHNLWSKDDKTKFINTMIRGFGKNNVLLSRIGQLKFERQLDELTPEQQQFYEPLEVALASYVIGARKNIEERRFFGGEKRDISKLRASIKKKKITLLDVKKRYPAQAKGKELDRLKYELSPIIIKLENFEKIENPTEDQVAFLEKLREKKERLESQIKWTEEAQPLQVKNTVIKRLKTDIEELEKKIKEFTGDQLNVENSIGAWVDELAQKGVIHSKDESQVKDLLVARFNAGRLNGLGAWLRDVSTIVTLNDITNAITQFGDLTFAAQKFGILDTLAGMRRVEGLSKKSLGLENIAEEFKSSSQGSISKWLNTQLKVIGLELIDGFGKNTVVNASIHKARRLAKKNDEKFNERLKDLFKNKADQVKQDLINNKITDDILFIAFNDLADIQPITADQMTENYQKGGFYRMLYVLKTYSIKALDILRNECFVKISDGKKLLGSDKKQAYILIGKGLNNLVKLQLFLWLFGVPKDLLKDFISNKEFNYPDYFIDNLIIFGIFNRYLVNKSIENPINIWQENLKLPAAQAIGDVYSGIKQVAEGKKELGEIYAWSRVPLVGKLYYNWLGGSTTKREEF